MLMMSNIPKSECKTVSDGEKDDDDDDDDDKSRKDLLVNFFFVVEQQERVMFVLFVQLFKMKDIMIVINM
jgi:hypothetical protein